MRPSIAAVSPPESASAASPRSSLRGKTVIFVSLLEPWSVASEVGAPSFYETLKGYIRAGARVHYITSVKDGVSEDAHAREIPAGLPELIVHRFRIPRLLVGRRLQSKAVRLVQFPLLAARQIQSVAQEHGADLVYAYESSAVLAAEWLRRRDVLPAPYIARYQGTILGARYDERWYAVRKLESLLSLQARASAYVMTDDGTLGDQALRYWNDNITDENLLFMRNGIDLSIGDLRVDRAKELASRGLDPGDTYLLTVCRLIEWKRVDRAIRVVAALKSRFPRLRLLVCGDGPARSSLERLAADCDVQAQVRFLGGQSRADVGVLMHCADIFLSLYDVSNCGNPLFEALLAGKPLITLNNGATASVIQDGVNGRIIDPAQEELL
ncbi:MAG TPA: glycosyltransferase family 4 protein, partial [Steroidobacter sp.]|nr:glycosyltransferase family 4 protein [Steroidobacter sp.]